MEVVLEDRGGIDRDEIPADQLLERLDHHAKDKSVSKSRIVVAVIASEDVCNGPGRGILKGVLDSGDLVFNVSVVAGNAIESGERLFCFGYLIRLN